MLTRRETILVAASGMAAALPLSAHGSPAVQQPSGWFDPAKPEDNLRGLVKVMGSLDGTPNWMLGSGRIYALREGDLPVPLFGVVGARYVKFSPEGERYRMFVRDWGYYTDYETGERLTTYLNPYTGETNTPAPLLTRFFSWMMGPDGQDIDGFTGSAWLIGRPLLMPWRITPQQTDLTLELLVKYGNGYTGGEWVNMSVNTDQFMDESRDNADMRYAWTGYSPWGRWMNMGDRPGRTLWNSTGFKTTSINDLDPRARSVFDEFFPGSLENPETYEKTSGLTTTEDE